jgi:hypothetical protein
MASPEWSCADVHNAVELGFEFTLDDRVLDSDHARRPLALDASGEQVAWFVCFSGP